MEQILLVGQLSEVAKGRRRRNQWEATVLGPERPDYRQRKTEATTISQVFHCCRYLVRREWLYHDGSENIYSRYRQDANWASVKISISISLITNLHVQDRI